MPDAESRSAGRRSGSNDNDVRAGQLRRFWHHLFWSATGSVVLAMAVYLLFGTLWPTLSFLALMLMMSVFFAAYYALLRIE